MSYIEKGLAILVVPALIFLHFLFLQKGNYTPIYGDLMLLVGIFFWNRRTQLNAHIRAWRLSQFWKVVFLIYGMVLFEEVFAALFNHFSEGFSLEIYFLRIFQFWAFNVIAFTGFVFGWAILTRRYSFSVREVFWISGILGLFNEGIYKVLLTNPLAFAIFALPTSFIYGIVATPAALALGGGERRHLNPFLKYALTFTCIAILSLPCIMVLQDLRSIYPHAFPPCALIAC
jgi:hypothetical protein